MKKGLNRFEVIGNVGDDAKLLYYPDGTPYIIFGIAINDFYTDEVGEEHKSTQWVECKINGKRGESLHPFINKGIGLFLDGKASVSVWNQLDENKKPIGEAKGKLCLQVKELRFVDSKPAGFDEEQIEQSNLSSDDVEKLFPRD